MNPWEEADLEDSVKAGTGAAVCIAVLDVLMGASGYGIERFLAAGVILGLAYGVYRMNRVCAVSLLAFYLAFDLVPLSKYLLALMAMGDRFSLKVWACPFILGGCLFGGVFGTFTHHATKKAPLPEDPNWKYEEVNLGGTSMRMRTHRVSGDREALHPVNGWVKMKPAGEKKGE